MLGATVIMSNKTQRRDSYRYNRTYHSEYQINIKQMHIKLVYGGSSRFCSLGMYKSFQITIA